MSRSQRENRGYDPLIMKVINLLKKQDHQEKESIDEVWRLISKQVHRKDMGRRTRYISVSAIASVVIFVIILSGNFLLRKQITFDDYVCSILNDKIEGKYVQIVLPDNKCITVYEDSSTISYSKDGTISVNDSPVIRLDGKKDRLPNIYNQVIVPKAKYVSLVLSDRSKLIVNNNTRIAFPRVFTGSRREIYVDGETLVDVTKDSHHPFVVETNKFDIQVLGTLFNVNAYKEESNNEVVLIRGSILLKDKHAHQKILKPNNHVSISPLEIGAVKYVDVNDYISWTKGVLILHQQTLYDVSQKLSRYYNMPINISHDIKSVIVEGKLDLKQSLPDLIQIISVAVPIDYHINKGTYFITSRN